MIYNIIIHLLPAVPKEKDAVQLFNEMLRLGVVRCQRLPERMVQFSVKRRAQTFELVVVGPEDDSASYREAILLFWKTNLGVGLFFCTTLNSIK